MKAAWHAPPRTTPLTAAHLPHSSLYSHIRTMAEAQAEGVKAAGGKPLLLRIKETMPAEVRAKVGGVEEDESHPEATADHLANADGILWGLPSRFGCAPGQAKQLLDSSTGGLWANGGLIGKPTAVFSSSNTQNGGVATIALTFMPNLCHHGMIFVPHGYRDNLSSDDEIHGCSPYGAGTIAGSSGQKQPSEFELGVAKNQGKAFTEVAAKLARK